MISLNHKITQQIKDEFFKESKKRVFKRLQQWDFSEYDSEEQAIANYFLDENNFYEIILGDFKWIENFIFEDKLKFKRSNINPKFKLDLLKKFNYHNFRKSEFAFNIFKKIGIKTCPYCNRTYTSLLKREHKSKKEWLLFFEIDHFYSKDLYPYFSHSLYNLIPVCGTCNRRKSDSEVSYKTHYNPYDESKCLNDHITFKYDNLSFILKTITDLKDIKIKIEETNKACKTSIENHKKLFAFDKLYETNSDETDELAQKYYMYYNVNLKNDEKIFKDVGLSNNEILRYISGVYLENDKILERPLGKLKRDLILDLNTNKHFIKNK